MKLVVRLCTFAAVFLLSIASTQVQAHTLSGLVTGAGRPAQGVVVDALVFGTNDPIATSTTNADGFYLLSLPSNTYDLRFTPPQGSGFEAQTVFNFAITADRTFDVLLLSSQPGSLAGTIRGRNGQPVPGATVYVNIGPFSGFTVTDALGHYAIDTINGPVYLQIFGNGPAGVAPDNYYVERYDVIVSGPTAFDLDLPVVQL